MIAFLIELWLAKHAHIDLRRDLIDETLAAMSAGLYLQTKEHGLSLADRACLALGIHRNCKVLTSERRMALPTLPIKVKLIRNAH